MIYEKTKTKENKKQTDDQSDISQLNNEFLNWTSTLKVELLHQTNKTNR